MVTFRNNNSRRSNFRRNDRSFKSNNDRGKFVTNFTIMKIFKEEFQAEIITMLLN